MREAEEQCCDAWAVWALPHAAKAYARALVDTVDFLSQRSVPLPAGASGIGQVQDLRRRLIMIIRGTTPRKLSATTLAGLLVLGGALLVLGPSFGQEQTSADSIAAIDPFRNPAVQTQDTVRTQAPNQTEIDRLRQQEQSLGQAWMHFPVRSMPRENSWQPLRGLYVPQVPAMLIATCRGGASGVC